MQEIRDEIDYIDQSIISMISKRFEYVKAAAKFKTSEASVKAAERLAAMLTQRRQWAEQENLNPDVIEKMYSDLVNYFILEELKHWQQQ